MRLCLLFCFILFSVDSSSQNSLRIAKEIQLDYEPNIGSIDRFGKLYLAEENGAIHRYELDTDSTAHISPLPVLRPSLIEAWDGLKVFCFYEEIQSYRFFNRFLTEGPLQELNPQLVDYAMMVCPSLDGNLWVVDIGDFSLKKVAQNRNEVLFSVPLLTTAREELDVLYMREYRSKLYILDKNNGILVFDNLGNLQTRYPKIDGNSLSYWGDDMYYLNEGKLYQESIVAILKPQIVELPLELKYCWKVSEEKYVGLSIANTIIIFYI